MVRMLRHKETGELFVYTELLSKLAELELVPEAPVVEAPVEIPMPAAPIEIPAFTAQPSNKPKHKRA